MRCAHCSSTAITEHSDRTAHGYQVAAGVLFRFAADLTGIIPETTTDKHAGYPPALEEVFGDEAACCTDSQAEAGFSRLHRNSAQ